MAAQTMVYHNDVVNQAIMYPMRSLFPNLFILFFFCIDPAFSQPGDSSAQTSGEDKALTVVSTIWPLHLLASEVLGEDGNSIALIDLNDSAHHFTLTPDDRIQIARADLLVWIDPQFEVQLTQLIESISTNKPVITVTGLDDVRIRNYSDGLLDPHLWLDPENGIAIAFAIADRLAQLAPAQAGKFQERASVLAETLSELQLQISTLGDQQLKPFFVYHDAYSYFESVAGLAHSAVLVDDPESEPSMRALLGLRRLVGNLSPECVILEPDASDALVASVFQETTPRKVVADVLGHDISINDGGYASLVNHIKVSFEECLQSHQ